MAKKSVNEMSFLDHLEDLRWHLIRATSAIMVVAVVAFIFSRTIFRDIIFAPLEMSFPTYRMLCKSANFIHVETTFCLDKLPMIIQNRTMAGQFSADIWTSIFAGFVIAFPYVLYQFWKFISPGLHENERKYSRGFILISSALFLLGVLFGYYIIIPLSINFLANYNISKIVENQIDISDLVYNLPNGIYFVKFGIEQSYSSVPFVIR